MFLKMNHSKFVLLLCSTQGQKLKLSLADKTWELFTKKKFKNCILDHLKFSHVFYVDIDFCENYQESF